MAELVKAEDLDYQEEIIENMTAEEIRSVWDDEILLWIFASGSGSNKSSGNYYAVMDYKGNTKTLEGEISGGSTFAVTAQAMIDCVKTIKKPMRVHMLFPCPMGLGNSLKGKGSYARQHQEAFAILKEKECTLSSSVVAGDVIREYVLPYFNIQPIPKENKYRIMIYRECLGKVEAVMRKHQLSEGIIEEVRRIEETAG